MAPLAAADENLPCYVIMRFEKSSVQTFRNRMIKSKSIMENYNGKWLVVAPDVCMKEGAWPRNKTVGVIVFASVALARRCLESDSEMKQPDFINGVDIIIVPLEYIPPEGKCVFSLIDLCIHDNDRFCNEYVPGHMPTLKQFGAAPAVCATRNFIKYRGLWDPVMLVLHQWNSCADFNSWYNSEEYSKWKELRQEIAEASLVVFEHDACEKCSPRAY